MTNITKETIKSLTELSRIGCSEKEQENLLKDLQKILSYVEQLKEIDTEDIPPCNHVLEGMANVFREDITGETMPRAIFLENAPSQVGGMIRVPPVLKQQ